MFDTSMVAPMRFGLHALFRTEWQRDEMTDSYRLWAGYDRDGRARDVTDVVPAKYIHLGRAEFRRICEQTLDGLFDLLLDDVVSTGWRVIAEPLGLKTLTEEA